jgi:hypothetical protein
VFGFWSKVLFLAIMIGVPVFVYQYYLADMMQDARDMYQKVRVDVESLGDLSSQVSLGAVIESIDEKRRELIE